MKTCLYNFDPLKPHIYIVKLGFTGVNIIFLISVQNIDCGYWLSSKVEKSDINYTDNNAKTYCTFMNHDKRACKVSNWSVSNCTRSCTHKVLAICQQML